ncbi:hypothetical protein GCM10017688_40690 [Streptomyces ramulosus]
MSHTKRSARASGDGDGLAVSAMPRTVGPDHAPAHRTGAHALPGRDTKGAGLTATRPAGEGIRCGEHGAAPAADLRTDGAGAMRRRDS